MRTPSIIMAVVLALAMGGAARAAEYPPLEPDGLPLRMELIGYGAAITLPAGFHFDFSATGAANGPLHTWSPFIDQSRMRAYVPTEGEWPKVVPHCGLVAYSQPRCPMRSVDLAAEVGSDLERVQLPVGEALFSRFDGEATAGGAYHQYRYWLTDGTDIYVVWCDGPERPADDWRSIAETFEFPARPHHAEAPTADSDLLEGVREVFNMHGGIGLGGPPWPEEWWRGIGYGWHRDIEDRLGPDWVAAPEVAAMEEHFGVPVEPTGYAGNEAFDNSGDPVLQVDGIRMPGREADDVLDGLVAWAEVEWERDEAGLPAYEDFPVAGRDVWRVTFADTDAVEYLYAQGDSAIRLHGLDVTTDHHTIRLFESLSCHHLPSQEIAMEWERERLFGPSSEASDEDS